MTSTKSVNRDFLKEYPLQFSLPYKEARELKKILKKLNESYILEVKESKGVKTNVQYYDFEVVCPTTNFWQAYFSIGIAYAEQVLPIWNKRHEKKKI